VSAQQLEMFENGKFLYSDPEFSSLHEWMKQCKRDSTTRLSFPKRRQYKRLQSRSTSSQVVIYKDAYKRDLPELLAPESKRIRLSPSTELAPASITASITQFHDPPSDNRSSSDVERVISHILEHKDVLGRRYYLVAWKGLPDDQATWLTPDELEELDFDPDQDSDTSSGNESECMTNIKVNGTDINS
jgi:hypothetical protein